MEYQGRAVSGRWRGRSVREEVREVVINHVLLDFASHAEDFGLYLEGE